MNKPIKIILSAILIASIAPAIAGPDKKDPHKKEREKYSFEPPPLESVRKVKTEIIVQMKGPKGKTVKVKDSDLNKLLAAINILVDNDQKAEKGQIKTHWYHKVKTKQYGVIDKIVNPPENKIFSKPGPSRKN